MGWGKRVFVVGMVWVCFLGFVLLKQHEMLLAFGDFFCLLFCGGRLASWESSICLRVLN